MKIAELRDEIIAADAKAAFDVFVDGFSALSCFSVHAYEQGVLHTL